MEKEIATAQELINTLIQFCVNYSFQIIVIFEARILPDKTASVPLVLAKGSTA